MAVILNILNIIILRRNPELFGETTTVFALAMSRVDAINGFCFLVLENIYMFTDFLTYHLPACWVVIFFSIFSNNSSLQFIACLTFDRSLAVRYPLRYHTLISPKKAKIISCLAVLLSLVVTLSSTLNRASSYDITLENTVRICFIDNEKIVGNNVGLAIFYFVCSFLCLLLPALFVLVANFYLFLVTIYHARRLEAMIHSQPAIGGLPSVNGTSNTTGSAGNNVQMTAYPTDLQTKVVRTFLVISGVFLSIWSPTVIFVALVNISAHNRILQVIVTMLLSCNSWTNAIIYFLMNKRYRREVRKLFTL